MIRVLIAAEKPLQGDPLYKALAGQPEVQVLDCVRTLSRAAELFSQCEVVLIDTNLPLETGYQLTRLASRSEHCLRVLVVGSTESKSTIIRFIEAGAQGFLRRDEGLPRLLECMQRALNDEAILPPDLAAAMMTRLAELAYWYEEMGSKSMEVVKLTPREREVLMLIASDFSNQDIADHLIIEVGTVKNHVHSILAKLKVNSRREAATYASMMKERYRLNGEPWFLSRREQYLASH